MFKYYLSKPILGLTLLLNLLVCSAQDIDTTRYTGPSICTCAKFSKNDAQLRSQCEQKYDYNAMSDYERSSFELKIKACSNPEICDCQERAIYDPELKIVCDKKFDVSTMSEEDLETHIKAKEKCYVRPIKKPSLKRICDCVNSEEYILNKEDANTGVCADIWDITNLTNSERLSFIDDISACITNKNDPDFTLSLCECLNASEDDMDLKERCINKFDLNNMNAADIAKYRKTIGDCSISDSTNDIDIICDCLKQEQQTGAMSSNCEKQLEGLEEKYKDKSPTEMEDMLKQLMDCLMLSLEK